MNMNAVAMQNINADCAAHKSGNQEENTMAFVNEHIPEADLAKYGIEEIDKRFVVGNTHDYSWTIDRERDIYLRCVARGREEANYKSTWIFYWHSELMTVCLEMLDAGGQRGGHGWSHYKLVDCYKKGFFISSHLLDSRDEIIADLKEALIAYGDGGIYSTTTSHETTLTV